MEFNFNWSNQTYIKSFSERLNVRLRKSRASFIRRAAHKKSYLSQILLRLNRKSKGGKFSLTSSRVFAQSLKVLFADEISISIVASLLEFSPAVIGLLICFLIKLIHANNAPTSKKGKKLN